MGPSFEDRGEEALGSVGLAWLGVLYPSEWFESESSVGAATAGKP